MNKNISIISILKSAWIDLKKSKLPLFIFVSMYFVIPAISAGIVSVIAWISPQSVNLAVFTLNIVMRAMMLIYASIISQNMLDIVYGRKLHWFFLSPVIMKASFASFLISYLVKLYGYGLNAILLQENSILSMVILFLSLTLYLCIIYFALRVMFINQFILEQDCTILEAVSRSWKMTEGRFWLQMSFIGIMMGLFLLPLIPLLLVFSYIDLEHLTLIFVNFDISQIDEVSLLVISLLMLVCLFIECYIVYPLMMLMIPHLFKTLIESEQL